LSVLCWWVSGLTAAITNVRDNSLHHTVFICSTCRKDDETIPKGDALAADMKAVFAKSSDAAIRDFKIEAYECMSACANPMAISFRAQGKAAYMFSGVDPVKDQQDILAFAKLYIAAKDGWIEDARPCGRLRHCLLGRIPADPVMVSE
jgi:predicted metal-binding protein